jgi:hypothetical protein
MNEITALYTNAHYYSIRRTKKYKYPVCFFYKDLKFATVLKVDKAKSEGQNFWHIKRVKLLSISGIQIIAIWTKFICITLQVRWQAKLERATTK